MDEKERIRNTHLFKIFKDLSQDLCLEYEKCGMDLLDNKDMGDISRQALLINSAMIFLIYKITELEKWAARSTIEKVKECLETSFEAFYEIEDE